MKQTDFINSKAIASMLLGALLLGSAGCAKNESPATPGGEGEKLPVFNFSTRASYTLNLKYAVPEGYQVYFEVYPENPLTVDDSGNPMKKSGLEPMDKGYTDASGNYKHPISVPSSVVTLYIYSPDAGVPQLLTAKVQGGQLAQATLPDASIAAEGTKAATRTVVQNDAYEYATPTLLLGKWSSSDRMINIPNLDDNVLWDGKARVWGRPDYLTYVDQNSLPEAGKGSALKIDADIWKTINAVLPGEGQGEVDPKVLQSGDIHVTKEADIDLFLLDEQCLNLNVLAYYCYPTGQAPASPSDIKMQTIALPNAKIFKTRMPNQKFGDITNYGAMLPGEGIRLHYIDQNGIDQGTKFPAGTSIGWILYSDGYKRYYAADPNVGAVEKGKLTTGEGTVYSDPNMMGGIPHVAVFRHGDFVVTSFEDGKKTKPSDVRDFKDVICHIASTPADAITPGVPDKDPDKPKETEVTYRGILSFEDNWPYQGDFDMNDVVVKYISTVRYNGDNEAVSATDRFTVLWSGAKYDNSFAFRNDNMTKGTGSFEQSGDAAGVSSVDPAGNIVRVVSNILQFANNTDKRTYVFDYKFSNPIGKDNFTTPPYNPFICVKGETDREVHLTNYEPTSYAAPKWFGYGHDKSQPEKGNYYITYDADGKQMPFAIDIAFSSADEMAGYVIPAETKSINTYYPNFMDWVASGGTRNSDWYLYPQQ